MGHWYTCFRLLVISTLGFKARVESSLVWFLCTTDANCPQAILHLPLVFWTKQAKGSSGTERRNVSKNINKVCFPNVLKVILIQGDHKQNLPLGRTVIKKGGSQQVVWWWMFWALLIQFIMGKKNTSSYWSVWSYENTFSWKN